jgi:hypothetical protein
MKKIESALALTLLLLHGSSCFAQSNAGGSASVEPTMIIDKPTAGMLHRGSYALNGRFFEQGGVLFGITVGLLDRFNFGISYGGTNILGADKPAMNPYPGVNVKLRILEESTMIPALAIGFDWQGKGAYVDDLKRYTIKSPGFYLVGSQNFSIAGNLSLHGGLNLSTEREDGDKDINLFVGAEKSIGKDISILAEYDAGLNDNSANALGGDRGRGYFNLGLRWSWGRGLVLGLDLKDIFKNQQDITVGNRTIQIEYVGNF